MTAEEAIHYARQNAPEVRRDLRENLLREYVQAVVLRVLEKRGFFDDHCFMGGTALRLLYRHGRFSNDLNFQRQVFRPFYRFSEDLDFESSRKSDIVETARHLSAELTKRGYLAEVSANQGDAIQRVRLRIPQILKSVGASATRDQKLEVVLEIDTRPPSGALSQTSLIPSPVAVAVKQ